MLEDDLLDPSCDRRQFLKSGLALSATALISTVGIKPVFAAPKDGRFKMAAFNLHTHESFEEVYRVGNEYLPEAFERINYVLRDHRSDEVFPIDPRTIDIATTVHRLSGSSKPFKILSGYRSPKTNAKLRAQGRGVAKQSLHLSGQAIDLCLEDVPTTKLRDIAINLRAGGVGHYKRSGFVHVDSGQFRTW